MERDSGRILFEKECCKQLPMASTTKIVTALTVLNNCSLADVVVIPKEACGIEGSSIYLREGEKLTVKELLYGLMLRSGNDCAVALALHVGGSIQNFAKMMNKTAADFGCTGSNFVNPHGLHDENHYTTARDLATITCNALKNNDFAQIVATKTVKIANDGYDYPRVLTNKNKLLGNFDDADGVKTGYTKKAGRCFVGSATRDGMQVVVVVLNCGPMFEETANMLDTAFANYQNVCIAPKNKLCGVVYRNNKPTYYYCDETFSYPIASGEKLTRNITLTEQVQTLDILLDGSIVKTIKLKATE
jgi:D-alanyl-D-alanine carboxypeptidase (penicillin-binding protein 5/6)